MKKLLIIVGLIISVLSTQAQGVKISAMPTWTDPIDSLWFPVINYDGANWVNYRAQGYLFAGGGSATRFGVSGEDDQATQIRDFDQNGNSLTIHGGDFQHLIGDGTLAGVFSTITNTASLFHVGSQDASANIAEIYVGYDPLDGVQLGARGASTSSGLYVQQDSISLKPGTLGLHIHNLSEASTGYVLAIDPITGLVSYTAASGGGGSSTRFGYSGEDDAAGENRIFNLSTFYLQLVAGQSQFLFSDGSMNFEQSDGTSIGRVYGSYGVSGIYSENASNSFGLEFNAGANSASFLMDASTQLWMGTNSGTWDWEIRGLQTGTASQVLYYDPVTHDISTGAAPSGGGGSGIQSIEGNNGVTVLNDSIVQLGSATQGASTLTAIRYIDALTDRLEINGTGTYTFRATTTTNRAISGEASGAGIGVTGTAASGFAGIGVQGTGDNASATGVQGNSVAGSAVVGTTSTGWAGTFTADPSSTNTAAPVVRILRTSSGTAADGIGAYVSFWAEYSSPSTIDEAARVGAVFTSVSTRTSSLEFTVKNSNSINKAVDITGSGNLRVLGSGKALALTSPDGTVYYGTINNGGTVLSWSTTAP